MSIIPKKSSSQTALSRPDRERITPNQESTLESLMIDLGLNPNCAARNSYLMRETGREIRAFDELTKSEASKLVGELIEKRTSMPKIVNGIPTLCTKDVCDECAPYGCPYA